VEKGAAEMSGMGTRAMKGPVQSLLTADERKGKAGQRMLIELVEDLDA
jgi:hypothetical protein